MDAIIRELTAMDRQAKNQVRQALEDQAQEKIRISQEKEDLREQYAQRVRETLDDFRQKTEQEFTRALERLETDYQQDLAALDAWFEKHRRQWTETIVRDCLTI
jgi:ribulose bisphosphate carboxylase small subunit